MIDIKRMADPADGKYFYPQTHYLAVQGLTKYVNSLMESKTEYAKYVKDLKSINTPGLFYFDSNTANKPANIPKGILQAIFIDEDNGIIEVLTTNYYFNVVNGVVSDIQERM